MCWKVFINGLINGIHKNLFLIVSLCFYSCISVGFVLRFTIRSICAMTFFFVVSPLHTAKYAPDNQDVIELKSFRFDSRGLAKVFH